MKKLLVVGVLLLSANLAWSQRVRGGGLPYRTYGSSHGFGNILFPGTGSPPPLNPGIGHIQRLGATIAGRPILPVDGGRSHRGRTVVVPYAFPVMVGGYGYPYMEPQPQVIVQAPPAPAAPQAPVIINQYYSADTARPTMREYREGELPESSGSRMREYQAPGIAPREEPPKPAARNTAAEDQATIYLIAFKDGNIHPSLSFWVQGDTLHYITMRHTHNQASVDLIDRELSKRLNEERNVEFSLPPAQN
jgi:hypothetical protein